jgi:hypothetical protein
MRLLTVSLSTMLALAISLGTPLPSRAASGPDGESGALAVVAEFKEKDPSLAKVFGEVYGYAVFPTVGKGGMGLGGARGKGYVYEQGRLAGLR